MSGKKVMLVSGGKRIVIIEIDRQYVVRPHNKRKLKHRDRECIVLDVVPISESHPHDKIAQVRFLDNNRQGRVELFDLVPVGELYEEEHLEE